MKALLCEGWNGWRGLKFTDLPSPALPDGSVRIHVAYATAGFGQTLVMEGKYQRKPPLPFVPGTEVSGVVSEVGAGVEGFAPGDRVAASLDWGGYGEEAVATSETVWHVPDRVGLQEAAAIPLTYGTSYAALHWRARLKADQTLLVQGAAGGVGLAAVEIGRLAGARVIAVARSEERRALTREFGAHEALSGDDPELAERVKALSEGLGADVVFEPVGGRAFADALRCTAPEGRIVVIGFASGDIPQVPANILLVKNIEVIGFNYGWYLGWSPIDMRRHYAGRLREMMATLFAHAAAGDFRPTTSDCHALGDFEAAFRAVVERRSTGRVLLKVSGE
jgi:NADPH2:quinone reductase